MEILTNYQNTRRKYCPLTQEGEIHTSEEIVEPFDLSKETLYARAERAAEYMTPVNLVGYIELTPAYKDKAPNMLQFISDGCEQLDKPRTSHSMIYLSPNIYVIGGIIDNLPTQSCKKYNTRDGSWTDIASIGFVGNLSSPAVVAFDHYILVFDCFSDQQYIHKYQVDFDVWENIPFNTPDFKIPKSLNSMVFR